MPILAGIPVKRFYVAKRRLASLIDAEARSHLGMMLAQRTLALVAEAGASPVVLAADEEVAGWAESLGWPSLRDQGPGLDAAAAAAARLAGTSPWMILHADLALLRPADLKMPMEALLAGNAPIAPSNDGGTSLIGGHGDFSFSYGTGSFHRHLARMTRPQVVINLGLCLDVDEPSDFVAAASHPDGTWLNEYALTS